MTEKLNEIELKLRTGQVITHEDAADLFQITYFGSLAMLHNGLTRDDLLVLLRRRFPNNEDLAAAMRATMLRVDAAVKTAGKEARKAPDAG